MLFTPLRRQRLRICHATEQAHCSEYLPADHYDLTSLRVVAKTRQDSMRQRRPWVPRLVLYLPRLQQILEEAERHGGGLTDTHHPWTRTVPPRFFALHRGVVSVVDV